MRYIHSTPKIKQRGFSYIEVLLSISLVVILIVPAMQALNTGIRGSGNCLAERQFLLRGKMEEVLSKPFGELYAARAGNPNFSDASGQVDSCNMSSVRKVALSYDSTTDLITVNVYFETEGSTSGLQTMVGKWW